MSTTNPTNITTQWEDQMVKRGIWAPREEEKKNEELYKERIDILESINPFENSKLERLIDVNVDKDEEFELELKAIREKRIASLKNKAEENRKFGELYFINKSDFIREVTEASKNDTVVVHLYKETIEECQIINRLLSEFISKNYGKIKFVKGISTDIIPNYPDKSLPTMIIYKNGSTIAQISGRTNFKNKSGNITVKSILKLFLKHKVINSDEINEYSGYNGSEEYSGRDPSEYTISDNTESESDEKHEKCYSSLFVDKMHEKIKYLQKI